MEITCIITDDEPMARKGLSGYVQQIGFLTLVGVCEDAMQLSTMMAHRPVDLLFLDIEMPQLSGIELIRSLPRPPKVIFTTAYEQYAIQGFELDVLDYLLKPIPFDRFLKSCNRAKEYFDSTARPDPGFTFLKADGRLEKVVFDEIVFVQAMENYVSIQQLNRRLIVHSTLKAMQEMLPGSRFIQVHKSYLVNMDCVTAVEGNILHLAGREVPIGKTQKDAVLERLRR